jgi:hypothetical protein
MAQSRAPTQPTPCRRKAHHKATKDANEEGWNRRWTQIDADDFFAPKAQESLSAFIYVHLLFHFCFVPFVALW